MYVEEIASFWFQVEGPFHETGLFHEESSDAILKKYQKDIKRKFNKLSIAKGFYNKTEYALGIAKHYVKCEEVVCLNPASFPSFRPHQSYQQEDDTSGYKCEAERSEDQCEKIYCEMIMIHDETVSYAEFQYNTLVATKMFFGFTDVDEDVYSKVDFLGPFPKNTTMSLELVNVPQKLMNQKQIDEFSTWLSGFLKRLDSEGGINEEQQHNHVLGIECIHQELLPSANRDIYTNNVANIIEGRSNLRVDFAVVSTHYPTPNPNYSFLLNQLILEEGEYLANLVKTKATENVLLIPNSAPLLVSQQGDILQPNYTDVSRFEYFIHLSNVNNYKSDPVGIILQTRTDVSQTKQTFIWNGNNKSDKTGSFLVLGVVSIFLTVVCSTMLFIWSKKRTSRKHRRSEGFISSEGSIQKVSMFLDSSSYQSSLHNYP